MQQPDSVSSTTGAHEQLIQELSTLLIHVNALQAGLTPTAEAQPAPLDPETLHSGLSQLEQGLRTLIQELRATDEEQAPPELAGRSLGQALEILVEERAEQLGLSSRIARSGEEQELPAPLETLFFRVAREAIYQVESHTGARRLRLSLAYGREDLQLSIEDDGTPASPSEEPPAPPFAPPPAQPADLLMRSLRHRAEHLGGNLELSSTPEQGTRVLLRLPYATQEQINAAEPTLASEPLPPGDRISLLVVESQTATRAGLRRLLESYPDLHVVGEAADGVQAVSETLELGPQVVLLDLQLPNEQSLEALRQLKQLELSTRVLVFSAQNREEYLYEALRAGADGYILKDIAPDELAQAIRAVARGEVLIQPQLAGQLFSRYGRQGRGYPHDTLTTREQEVLRLLARGLRNKEIASRLSVSERTVNFHLANIYQKLNVSGRTEALSRALEQGLITA